MAKLTSADCTKAVTELTTRERQQLLAMAHPRQVNYLAEHWDNPKDWKRESKRRLTTTFTPLQSPRILSLNGKDTIPVKAWLRVYSGASMTAFVYTDAADAQILEIQLHTTFHNDYNKPARTYGGNFYYVYLAAKDDHTHYVAINPSWRNSRETFVRGTSLKIDGLVPTLKEVTPAPTNFMDHQHKQYQFAWLFEITGTYEEITASLYGSGMTYNGSEQEFTIWAQMAFSNYLSKAHQPAKKQPTASDYIFVVKARTAESSVRFNRLIASCDVFITPKTYFDKHGAMYDQHLKIDKLLPSYFEQVMEGVFEVRLPSDKTRQILLEWGFKEDPAFTAFMQTRG